MFLLKQFVKALILPPGIWLLLLAAVLIFWKRSWARKLLLATIVLIFLLHSGIFAMWIARPLESRYKPLLDPRAAEPYDAIVSLMSGAEAPSGLIPFPILDDAQFLRLEETVRLYKLNPKPVVVCGGHLDSWTPDEGENKIVCDYLVAWGVPARDVTGEAGSRDTFEAAREVAKILREKGWRRYLLVTSASHMPRSMMVFERLVPGAIAAPGDFTVRETRWSPLKFKPDEGPADDIRNAIQEYIGLVNCRLRLFWDADPR